MEGRGTVPSRPSQWAGTRDLDLLGWHGSAVFTGEAFGCWAPGSLRADLRQRRAACDHRATHGAAVTLRRRCCREAGHVARGPGQRVGPECAQLLDLLSAPRGQRVAWVGAGRELRPRHPPGLI